MKTLFISTLLVILFLGIISCNKNKIIKNDIEISYIRNDFYLKLPKNSDALSPPYLNLTFSVKNNTDCEKIIPAKFGKYDNIKSKFIILDTINNRSILLSPRSGVYSINSNSIQNCEYHLKLKKNYSFFNIDKKNIETRMDFDYSAYKEYYQKKVDSTIKNSIIFYIYDSTDVEVYKYQYGDKNISLKNKLYYVSK